MCKNLIICLAAIVCLLACCGLGRAGQPDGHQTISCMLSSEANNNIIHVPPGYSAVGADVSVVSAGDQQALLTVVVGGQQTVLPLETGSRSHVDLGHEQGSLPASVFTDNALAVYAVSIEVECFRDAD